MRGKIEVLWIVQAKTSEDDKYLNGYVGPYALFFRIPVKSPGQSTPARHSLPGPSSSDLRLS
jgi:hypothetical protein